MPTPPSASASHCAAAAACGASRATRSSLPAAAMLVQPSAIFAPTSGMRESHSGGGGIDAVASVRTHSVIVSLLSTSVWIARTSGTTNTRTIAPDMIVTARARLRSQACSLSIIGHVATTIIAAQMIESRNGRRIQNEAPMRITISSTASTVRVRSRWVLELGSLAVMCASHVSRFGSPSP